MAAGGERMVEVCDACLRADCWHASFNDSLAHRCDSEERDVVLLPVSILDKLRREPATNYSEENIREAMETP